MTKNLPKSYCLIALLLLFFAIFLSIYASAANKTDSSIKVEEVSFSSHDLDQADTIAQAELESKNDPIVGTRQAVLKDKSDFHSTAFITIGSSLLLLSVFYSTRLSLSKRN